MEAWLKCFHSNRASLPSCGQRKAQHAWIHPVTQPSFPSVSPHSFTFPSHPVLTNINNFQNSAISQRWQFWLYSHVSKCWCEGCTDCDLMIKISIWPLLMFSCCCSFCFWSYWFPLLCQGQKRKFLFLKMKYLKIIHTLITLKSTDLITKVVVV